MTWGLLFLVGLALLVAWAFANRRRYEQERRDREGQ